jgi:ATP-dependent DNA ligase
LITKSRCEKRCNGSSSGAERSDQRARPSRYSTAALWAPTSDPAVLFAFDLLELGGKDLRRAPLEERKGVPAKLVRKASWAVQLK